MAYVHGGVAEYDHHSPFQIDKTNALGINIGQEWNTQLKQRRSEVRWNTILEVRKSPPTSIASKTHVR